MMFRLARSHHLLISLSLLFGIISNYLQMSPFQPVLAFAAAKKGKSKSGGEKRNKKSSSSAASTNRGFGTAPPTLEEVLNGFQTQIPKDTANQACPCGLYPAKTYNECCQPYHLEVKHCLTPLSVLQSRYTAFKYRVIGHIINTTHPKCRDYQEDQIKWAKSLNKDGMFDSYDFVKLDVLSETQISPENENEAFIEFQVTVRGRKDGKSQQTVIAERSQFLKDPTTSIWKYSGGDVQSKVPGLEDTILNK